jgi:hypothetical protein
MGLASRGGRPASQDGLVSPRRTGGVTPGGGASDSGGTPRRRLTRDPDEGERRGPEDTRGPEESAAPGDRDAHGISPRASDPAFTIGDHDPEGFAREGMSEEAADVDEAETMASSGDASNSFQEIASGSATGLGIDRGESLGTGGLAAGEDEDEVAEGDWWRQGLEDPAVPNESSVERYDLEGRRLGWESGVDFEREQLGLDADRPSGVDAEPPTGTPDDYEE